MSVLVSTPLRELHKKMVEVMPSSIKELVEKHTYFAGGCVRDLARGKVPNDYDIFFDSKEALDAFCKVAETTKCFEKSPLGNFDWTFDRKKIQFITLLCGNPFDVIYKFDFTINSVYYFPYTNSKHITIHTELIFNTLNHSPVSTMMRLARFLKDGYTINETQLLKMAVVLTNQKAIKDSKMLEEVAKGISAVNAINAEDIINTLARDTLLFKELE